MTTPSPPGSESLLAALTAPRPPHLGAPLRYLCAPITVLLAYLVQEAVLPERPIAPFVFFFFGVSIAAWVGGTIPGLLATLLSGLVANYAFLDPSGAWATEVPALRATALFLTSGVLIALVTGGFRAAVFRAERTSEILRDQAELLQQSHDAIFTWRLAGSIESWNHGAEELYGYSAAEALGRAPHGLLRTVPPEALGPLDEVLRERGRWEGELRHTTKDGRVLVVQARMQVVRSVGGTRVLETTRDITERRRMVEHLRESEQRLREARDRLSRLAAASLHVIQQSSAEAMLQAIAETALDLTGARYSTCGHGLLKGQMILSGSARAFGAPGCPAGEIFRLDKGGVHRSLIEGSAAIRLTDAELRAHPRWWGLPADHVPTRGLLGVPIFAGDGVGGMILVTDKAQGDFTAEDESLLRQLATVASVALQHVEARLSLEAADQRKDHFLAMLSHELRNPLAPIRSSLYVLDRVAPGSGKAQRARAVVSRQVGHMTRIVDDLLDVTRIARGKIQIQREPLDFTALVRAAVEDHRAALSAARLHLSLDLPARALWLDGDRTRLTQVLTNILQNAAKFTPAGGEVAVSVEVDEARNQAVARVRDSGAGIPGEVLPHVFEPFIQADTTLDRSKGGLGLGLALARGLVEMHGGEVSAASDGPGRGAEITIRLPLHLAAEIPAPPASARRPVEGLRVLVVDDNIDGAESIREVLELCGHSVEVAFSGIEGLERARSCALDVVLCDIGLPGMNGYDVARAIKAELGAKVPRLVALTGYASPEDVARSSEAGFDAHLAKPPTVEMLEGALVPTGGDEPPGSGRAVA